MKKKVKFGRDLNESLIERADSAQLSSRQKAKSLSSLTDGVSDEHTFPKRDAFFEVRSLALSQKDVVMEEGRDGFLTKATTQQQEVLCSSQNNLTIRLKIRKGAQMGEINVEDGSGYTPDASLLGIKIRDTRYVHFSKKQDHAWVDPEPTCQIDGCTADLASANSYFRRNKVCLKHFKAFKVEVGDSEHRFCQQCNRFQMLAEFDEDRRSCRLMLAGHNNRRKRSLPEATSVLSTGTLVYLPEKARNVVKNKEVLTDESVERTVSNEDTTERTVTNEETSGRENNLRDDASSESVCKVKGYCGWDSIGHMSSQSKCTGCSVEARFTKLGKVELRDGACLEPCSVFRSKNTGSKKTSVSHSASANMCQVEGCMFDLSSAKDYFKRRKVCEQHFKASIVKVNNIEQRFCQQCSRFHVLAEFDEGRKSCKKMLMGHNMRRRKASGGSSSSRKG